MNELEGFVNKKFHSFFARSIDGSHGIWYISIRKAMLVCPRPQDRHPNEVFSIDPYVWESWPKHADFLHPTRMRVSKSMAKSKITWSKMDFKDFISHFKGKTREEIADDVIQSIKDFEELNTDNGSFGSEQVKKAKITSSERRAAASRENGKLGGRPKGSKNKSKTEPETDMQKRTETALKALIRSCPSTPTAHPKTEPSAQPKPQKKPYQKTVYVLPKQLPKQRTPLPKSKDDVMDMAYNFNLDYDDAHQWWFMTMEERNGKDRWGNPIFNWKGALINYCKVMASKRAAPA